MTSDPETRTSRIEHRGVSDRLGRLPDGRYVTDRRSGLKLIPMDALQDYPVVVEIPVAWGDMDALGHVNNVVYFRYFETARLRYLERIGFSEQLQRDGIGPILASTSCRFRLPLTYPDTVLSAARVSDIGDDRFRMQYAVYSRHHERIAADGDGWIVAYDYRATCKRPLPGDLVEAIRALEPVRGA